MSNESDSKDVLFIDDAYSTFMKVRHAELKICFPEKTFVEICSLVAKDWSGMTKEQHAKFNSESDQAASSDDADADYYEVERILGHRGSLVNPDAWWFLIKWVGFDDSHNEWLPRCDVSQEAIDEYMALDQEYMCSTNPMAPPERVKGSCQAVVSQTGNFCKNSGPYVCCGDKVYCRSHIPMDEVKTTNLKEEKNEKMVGYNWGPGHLLDPYALIKSKPLLTAEEKVAAPVKRKADLDNTTTTKKKDKKKKVDDMIVVAVGNGGGNVHRLEAGAGGNCLLFCLLLYRAACLTAGSLTVRELREMIPKRSDEAGELREMIAKHMRDHFKFFADHISDEDFIDSGLPLFATPEEQMFHDADLDKSCNLLRIQRFINDGIAKKNAYLGQIAITAFSRMYPDLPPIFMLQKLDGGVQVNPLYNNPNVNIGLFYSKAEQHYQIIVRV